MTNESKSQLISWLDCNGWMVCEMTGKEWELVSVNGEHAKVSVTAHRDGRCADYEIITTW